MTDAFKVTCPQCAEEISVDDVLSRQVEARFKADFAAESARKEAELVAMERALREELTVQEQAILAREEQVAQAQQSVQAQLEAQLAAEKVKLAAELTAQTQEAFGLKLQQLETENAERKQKLEEAQKNELELRRKSQALEERQQALDLELQRKLDEERVKIVEATKRQDFEESRLKLAEKDKQLEMMQRTIEDLKRQSEQGSMQIQGEVQEADLKDVLGRAFASDTVEDVKTGARGADLVQKVRTQFGQEVGVVLWESKNTKEFSPGWLKKLKDDRALVKADVCVLVSRALPEGIETFGFMEDVFVVEYGCVLPLAGILRSKLIELYQVKQSLVGRDEKMEVLYSYLSGSQFRNRIQNIVGAFESMKTDLESEKRSMMRIWSKREKEIERVVMNTTGMYGDLQGIVGASLPTIQALELAPGSPEDEHTGTLF